MEADQDRTCPRCVVSECARESCVLCHCCTRNYCYEHIITHNNSSDRQLNSLIVDLNELTVQFKNLKVRPILDNCREKLDKHRAAYHLKIDRYFEQKYYELSRFIDNRVDYQQVKLNHLQSKLQELTRQDEINSEELDALKTTIIYLQEELDHIQQMPYHIDVVLPSLDDNLINIEHVHSPKFDRNSLSTITRTINHPYGSEAKLSTNDKYLLTYLSPNFVFIDTQLGIAKQVSWPHATVSCICWSSSLNRFIVIMNNRIYLVDDQSMSIKDLALTTEKRKWCLCACSDVSLFLASDNSGSSIMEFSMLPTIKLINDWNSPFTCRKDEYIDDLVYNNLTLALMIAGKTQRTIRMELRSSKKLERIWSLQLDIERCHNRPFHCCSIHKNEWLVADYQNQRLLYITKDGYLKVTITYDSIPFQITLFDENTLAVSRKNGINFHRL